MVHYVKTMDELVELVDKEFSSINALCPICKNKIGTVNIPNIEIGLDELKFTQFKNQGIYCTEGHCIISMEEDTKETKKETKKASITGICYIRIEDLGIKVFEVMRLIKPYLDVDESIPNEQLYWMLMSKDEPLCTRALSGETASDLLDTLQRLRARACIL